LRERLRWRRKEYRVRRKRHEGSRMGRYRMSIHDLTRWMSMKIVLGVREMFQV
jgi:hypothetical protein